MRCIPGITLDDAALSSTTVPEAAPATYSGGTTYAEGDTASTGTVGAAISVYQSLQGGNTGHTPSSSPTWWKLLGTTYSTYDGAHTYAADDVVIDTTNHLTYQSLAGSNTGNALTDATKWLELGPTNRWAALDLYKNTGATAPSPMTYEFTPGQRIDSVGLVGMVADEVAVTVTVDGDTKYSQTVNLVTRDTATWSDYFLGVFNVRSDVGFYDLPPKSSAVITVTLTRAEGDCALGGVIMDRSVFIGETIHDPVADAVNYSTIDRGIDGTVELIARRNVPKTNQRVVCDRARVNIVRRLRDSVNAKPAFWSWLDDNTDEYFDSGEVLGLATTFSITFDQPEFATVTLEIEGM